MLRKLLAVALLAGALAGGTAGGTAEAIPPRPPAGAAGIIPLTWCRDGKVGMTAITTVRFVPPRGRYYQDVTVKIWRRAQGRWVRMIKAQENGDRFSYWMLEDGNQNRTYVDVSKKVWYPDAAMKATVLVNLRRARTDSILWRYAWAVPIECS